MTVSHLGSTHLTLMACYSLEPWHPAKVRNLSSVPCSISHTTDERDPTAALAMANERPFSYAVLLCCISPCTVPQLCHHPCLRCCWCLQANTHLTTLKPYRPAELPMCCLPSIFQLGEQCLSSSLQPSASGDHQGGVIAFGLKKRRAKIASGRAQSMQI